MCVIVIVAFLLRTVFVYGLSAGGDFALSGGSSAQNHLHVVESILNGTFAIGTDAAVNYPLGGLNVVPPLMDYIAAAVAGLLCMFGMGSTEAASAALAVLPPILGTLTCIPVYAVGKEFFDKRIGVVAALIFAFLALPISSSVFSNGTEYALTGFLIACMSFFLIRGIKLMESDAPAKSVYLNSLVCGLYMGLIALAWNGFGLMVLVVAAPLLLQVVFDRIKGKDFTVVLIGHSLTLLVGIAIAAVYYIPAGLWDAVFSGPLLLAVLTVIFGFLFKALSGMPWINVIPMLFVAFAVILVALFFGAPELYSALVYGNPIYTGTMSDMVADHVSMSNVSSYYGWLTMWLPICLALYEIYVYVKGDRSYTKLFLITWLLLMFFAVWSGYSSAAVVGVVFAVGSAAVIVKVLVRADLREWVKSIRFAGFPSGFRKLIKPLPFASVLITALLVIAPNFTYAVDAGMSNNIDGDHSFSGNTQFVVKTGDSYPIGNVWDEYADVDKDGAAVIWLDYVADAVAQGNFYTVADSYGEGAEATAQMILSKGSAGMTAAMMLRLIMSGDVDDYSSVLPADVFSKVKEFIQSPSKAKVEISTNPPAYGDVRSDMADEDAVYLACIEAITSEMDAIAVDDAYDTVRDMTNKGIDYVVLDPSLLPISYGGGDSFASVAYFAGYDVDGYGAIPEFFTYNTTYGYTTYTDAMYETFLWKALIGPSAKDAGFTSSYSYLYSLSASDGSVVAMPGYGLMGYEVAFWQVMYNADSNATSASDGWEYMPIDQAVAKQKADGGLINYLSSIVVLEYVGVSAVSVGSLGTGYPGLTVEVFEYDELAGAYRLVSSDVTDDNGDYRVSAVGADDMVVISNGALELATALGFVPFVTGIPMAEADAFVYVGDEKLLDSETAVVLTSIVTGDEVERFDVAADGSVNIVGIIPGEYTIALVDATGASLSTATVTLAPGENDGLKISPKSYNITVTVKDINGKLADAGYSVFATENTSGVVFTAETGEDGKAVIAALPGSYKITAELPTASYPSVTVSKSNTTSSVVVTKSLAVSVATGAYPVFVYAGDLSYMVSGGTVDLPKTAATEKVLYTIYGTDGENVTLGTYTTAGVDCDSGVAVKVSGTVAAGATVAFVNADGATVKAVADSDGKYAVYLLAGDYTVHADNGKDKAYLGTASVTADKDDLDITLVDGRSVSLSVKYQSGTSSGYINQPFVYVKAELTIDTVKYTLYDMTDSNGKAAFVVPDDVAVDLAAGDDDGEYSNDSFTVKKFTKNVTKGTGDSSNTVYIYNKSLDNTTDADENHVNKVTVTPAFDAELTYYSDKDRTYQFVAGTPIEVVPGQYTAKISTDSKYFDGTVNIYPDDSNVYGLEPVDVVKVTVTKGAKDVVSVESEGGKFWKDGSDYWLQVNDEDGNKVVYTFKSVNSSGDDKTVKYAVVDTASAASPVALDMTATETQMDVTGSIGVDADGTITAKKDGVAIVFDVKDGQYTMTLPSSWTEITVDVEAEAVIDIYDSTYAVTDFALTGLADDAIRNVPVVTDSFVPSGDSSLDLQIVDIDSNDTYADLTLKLTGGEAGMTYILTPGDAWSFDKAYSIVDGEQVTVRAYFNQKEVSMMDSGLTITVADVNGGESVTIHTTLGKLDDSKAPVIDASVNDVVTASQYRYAVKIDNSANGNRVTAQVSVDGLVGNILTDANGNKWYVTYTDNVFVREGASAQFSVPAFGPNYIIYVCLMSLDGQGSVPDITIDVTAGTTTMNDIHLEPQSLDLNVDDMTVSGGSALNERSGVPMGVWFMLAVGLILVVATFYLASKRGVFSRRN